MIVRTKKKKIKDGAMQGTSDTMWDKNTCVYEINKFPEPQNVVGSQQHYLFFFFFYRITGFHSYSDNSIIMHSLSCATSSSPAQTYIYSNNTPHNSSVSLSLSSSFFLYRNPNKLPSSLGFRNASSTG